MKRLALLIALMAVSACSSNGPTGLYDGNKYCQDLAQSSSFESLPEMCQWRVMASQAQANTPAVYNPSQF